MFRHKSFWIILVITAFAWVISAMSERSDHSVTLRLRWDGYDTARYVVSRADTVLPVTIKANTFQAVSFVLAAKDNPFVLSVSGDTVLKVNSILLNEALRQYQTAGVKTITSPVETLHIKLSERERRGYVPTLRNVEFRFADRCGLCGNPVVEPDTVWLYGDPVSLDKIVSLSAAPAVVSDITDSGWFTLALDPVWSNFRDVHSSADSIRVFIPTLRYVETALTVPITPVTPTGSPVNTPGGSLLRTIPERVNVTLWVPDDYPVAPTASQIQAVAVFSPDNNSDLLPVQITRFPAGVRIKSISPSQVQYVIIKKN